MNSGRGESVIQEINVQIDQQAIKKHIEKQLDECIVSQLWFVDCKRISELTSMSVRFLEDEVFSDPRMRVIEKRKNRKRLYPAAQAFEVISEIMNEW